MHLSGIILIQFKPNEGNRDRDPPSHHLRFLSLQKERRALLVENTPCADSSSGTLQDVPLRRAAIGRERLDALPGKARKWFGFFFPDVSKCAF